MLKKSASRGWDGPVSPLCSRNARSQKTLVGRAQWGTHPGHPGDNVNKQAWKDHLWSLAAALLDGLFEHPVGVFFCGAHGRTIDMLACQHSFSSAC
jgi:hypothetical protein